ncbi:NADPH-dependent FMN reductase [Paenibacillus sp. GSMTC-2017]|uniref:NADPH-dependent FMN reductase n=1 Tax=Paenibacillus sp. GSMTC-2017 TaxID=2794350 RepID=UPI0018D98B40|nr:NADPH-dependent FMN reductase [Paenibacillus sp. GSMTC-2017]MBH5317429.1 NADPH-dependent FMN reductase [Paenibacillus sp. GSMTC-2017]
MPKIVILSGSANKNSRLNGIIQYSRSKLEQAGHEVSIVEITELPAEDLIHSNWNSAAVQKALTLVEEADGVIAASPVYKAAYSGVFKTFLDLIPQKGLERKVILPLFIGGTISHLLVIDYSLKPVLSALGATNILGGVYAVDQSVIRLEDGTFHLAEEISARLEDALVRLNEETALISPKVTI